MATKFDFLTFDFEGCSCNANLTFFLLDCRFFLTLSAFYHIKMGVMNDYFTYIFSFPCNWAFGFDTCGVQTLAKVDRRCCIWNDFRCFHRKGHLCELVFLALDTDRASQALCQNFGVGEADADAGTHIVVVVLNSVNNLVSEDLEKRLLSFFADSLTRVTNCGFQELIRCVVVLSH